MRKLFGSEWFDEVDIQKKTNLSLWQSLFFLMFVNAFLVYGYFDLKGNTNFIIKMPPTETIGAKHIVYNLNGANVSYFELWGRYLVRETANFSPNDINKKMKTIYGEMRPSDKVKKKKEIEKFTQFIVLNKLSQDFKFLKVKADIPNNVLSKKVSIEILGISTIKRGTVESEPKECSYKIDLEINEGVFYVKSIGTNCIS